VTTTGGEVEKTFLNDKMHVEKLNFLATVETLLVKTEKYHKTKKKRRRREGKE